MGEIVPCENVHFNLITGEGRDAIMDLATTNLSVAAELGRLHAQLDQAGCQCRMVEAQGVISLCLPFVSLPVQVDENSRDSS